jgi:gliding motility-associated-like protein
VYTVIYPGWYWVEVTAWGGCSSTDSIYIGYYPPVELDLGNDTTLCEGGGYLIDAGAGYTSYQWQDSTTSQMYQVNNTGIYWVTVTDANGCTATDTVNVIISEAVNVSLGNDTTVCSGDNYQLEPGQGYTGYLWQDSTINSIFQVIQSGLYWVIVTDENGCQGIDSVNITVEPSPAIDIGNDTIVCEIGEIQLDAGAGYISYHWQDGSTQQTYTVTQSGIYWVEVTGSNGCTGNDTIHVGLSPAVQVSLGPDTTLCSDQEYILQPGSGFISYQWQDGSSGEAYIIIQSGQYWVSVTDINGCTGQDTVNITVHPSPAISLGNDTTICSGSTLLLSPGLQYSSYLWQDNSTGQVYSVSSSGYYTVTVTNIYGCQGSDAVNVTVSDPEVELGSDSLICQGDTIELDAGTGYNTYEWHDGSHFQTYQVYEGGTCTVKVTDIYGCTDSSSISFISYPKPQADLGEDLDLCRGDTLILQTQEGPYEYYWNGNAGSNKLQVTTGGTYRVEVKNACGTSEDNLIVTEYLPPEVSLGADRVLLPGEEIQLDAGSGYTTYTWQDGSGGQYYIITANTADADNPYYHVQVYDGHCKGSDTIKVEKLEVWVPQVMTPNGDGMNDLFEPDPGRWYGIGDHTMIVFNRWGEKVWETSDFLQGWDGRFNGRLVSEGTYYWILEIYYGSERTKQTFKGSLTILDAEN